MNNAKKEGVKAIFAPVSISYAQLIIDQATAQGVNVPILGSDTWDTNTIFEVAKGKDIDIYVSTFYQEGAKPPNLKRASRSGSMPIPRILKTTAATTCFPQLPSWAMTHTW